MAYTLKRNQKKNKKSRQRGGNDTKTAAANNTAKTAANNAAKTAANNAAKTAANNAANNTANNADGRPVPPDELEKHIERTALQQTITALEDIRKNFESLINTKITEKPKKVELNLKLDEAINLLIEIYKAIHNQDELSKNANTSI